MASIATADGIQPISEGIAQLAVTSAPSEAQIAGYVDLAISLVLARWNALSIAVANEWGGPDSADKRDWLAGAISQLFQDTPETDEMDVETVLLQVMADEFDLELEDESEVQAAADIVRLRRRCLAGDFAEVDAMRKKWEEKGAFDIQGNKVNVEEREELVDEDDMDDGVELQNGAGSSKQPPPAPRQPKPEPEIDDDGFTTVRRKK